MTPQLTIQLLGWNSTADLTRSLAVLATISKDEVVIRYIDNHSSDNSIDVVKQALPNAEIIALPKNVGYSGGHNVGFAACTTPYVLVLNPDVEIDWQGIKKILHRIASEPSVAAIQGLLLRQGSDDLIDSAGVVRTRTLNGIDRGTGEKRGEQFTTPSPLDAISGACGLFRMEALRQVAHGPYQAASHEALEVFDKDFFAYKEDVDLGWRLQNAAWKIHFDPAVTGYHRRTLKSEGVTGWGTTVKAVTSRLRNRRTKLSLRNYVWMIVKNASLKQLLLHEIFIDVRLLFFFGMSLLYWPLFSSWVAIIKGLPTMLEKRSQVRYVSTHS